MLKARCYRLAPLLFGGNHILVIFAQNICIRSFFGLKMQNSPCPGKGTPPPRPSPARSLRSLAILLAEYFRRVSETWNLFFVQNCHKSIQNKVDIALYRASRIPELPGPWTPAAICFSPRGVDPGGGGGGSRPPMKILGANISFCPPPQ